MKDITPEEMDRIVALLDRMLDLAVALDCHANREEFLALHRRLGAITTDGND